MNDLKYIGKPLVRSDGKEKISGATLYTDDLEFGPNLHFAAIVESTEAHAEIISIDTFEAEKILSEGADAFFTKPLDFEKLIKAMKDLLTVRVL